MVFWCWLGVSGALVILTLLSSLIWAQWHWGEGNAGSLVFCSYQRASCCFRRRGLAIIRPCLSSLSVLSPSLPPSHPSEGGHSLTSPELLAWGHCRGQWHSKPGATTSQPPLSKSMGPCSCLPSELGGVGAGGHCIQEITAPCKPLSSLPGWPLPLSPRLPTASFRAVVSCGAPPSSQPHTRTYTHRGQSRDLRWTHSADNLFQLPNRNDFQSGLYTSLKSHVSDISPHCQ